VNKIDTAQHSPLAAEFYRLGVQPIVPLSAEHGLGVDDLLDHLTAGMAVVGAQGLAPLPEGPTVPPPAETVAAASLAPLAEVQPDDDLSAQSGQVPPEAAEETVAKVTSVAIIGRPNVGKSTLLNRLLNEERSIVTPLPGTTRDAVDAEFERDGLHFRFVDTAGIRRKGKTKLLAEKLSVMQARKHLERADVALLVLDAPEGVTALDTHIGGYAHESHRSVVIVVNKWDAIRKGPTTTHDYTLLIRRRMKYLDYAPIVFISALRGQRLGELLKTIAQVAEARRQRIGTAEMNRFLQEVDFERTTVPAGRPSRVYYLTQAGVAPPTFVVFTNRSGKLHFSFERFLENRIRERFGFLGSPIVIKTKSKGEG